MSELHPVLQEILNSQVTDPVALREQAAAVRNERFGKRVFVRAVVEISNFCRQNCSYCGMRRENRALERYRIDLKVLRQIILESLPASVTDINLQAGEDPVAVREIAIPLIREITQNTKLGVSVCLGTLSEREYAGLREAGADYYILKLETGDPEQYKQVNAPGTLEKRLQAIRLLAENGWKVSSGLIYGLPAQTPEVLTRTVQALCDLPLSGCSVSPFIPGEQTPFSTEKASLLEPVIDLVAGMRIARPHWVIPAVSAMNIAGPGGYVKALCAGANLATINLTPEGWRENYLLYKRNRYLMSEQRILSSIQEAGCEPSSVGLVEYLRPEQVMTG